MKKIFKYKLMSHTNSILMPIGAKILCVQTQNNEPMLWAEVMEFKVEEWVYFSVIPTGMDFYSEDKEYIGSFQMDGGTLVFHVYKHK